MRVARRRLLSLLAGGVSSALACAVCAAAAGAPVPSTGGASALTSTTATVSGTIAPAGNRVAYEFQFGTSTAYTVATIPLVLPATSVPEYVSARISGLKPRTTYHYRLVISTAATSSRGVYYPIAFAGADRQFTTLAKPRRHRRPKPRAPRRAAAA